MRRTCGFTLVEVMIVVAIVAILAAIAYPSYIESVRKSRRAEARGHLLEASQYMQRFYSQNDRFDQDLAGVTTTLPTSLAQVPKQGARSYGVKFAAGFPTRSAFALEAVPEGSMSDDRCGTLGIDNVGRRTITGGKTGMSPQDCWR